MPDRHMPQRTPLQQKLLDKALAAVATERSKLLEPLHGVLRGRASGYAYTCDAATEDAVSRAIEPMLPNWGGTIVEAIALPDDPAAIADALIRLAHPYGADGNVVLWFEATLHSQSALVAFEDCRYGVFTGALADLAHVVGHIKGTPGSPVGWSRLALVAVEHRWMIWIEASLATHCTPAADD